MNGKTMRMKVSCLQKQENEVKWTRVDERLNEWERLSGYTAHKLSRRLIYNEA